MSTETIVYGIKNCDSVKAARKWLEARGIAHRFHDLRADGISKDQLQDWLDRVGPEQLINTKSATYRQLSPRDQQLATGRSAAAVVLANPTLIKRPVITRGEQLIIGFDETALDALDPA